MAMKPIQILINAKDNASGVFDKLQTKVAAVGVAIAGYFGIQAFKGVVQGAADLEQAMSRVQAATGATAEEMVQLRAAAEGAASGTKFTAVDTAAALENLAKAGLSASEAIATLPAATALAQAGDIELAQSAEFLTKAVMGMGLAFSDAGRVADVLALGANATNTSVTGLAQALSYAAPVAQSLGLSLESTVAIIGKFADAGIDASRAGTALNSILSQFSNPATKFRQELAAAGITTTNFEDALRQLAASGARGERAINAIGQEAGPALRALLNQGMGSLDELGRKLRNAEGSAAATAATMRNNLTGAMGGLRSAWDAVSNALGTPVLPVLQAGVEKLTGALTAAVKGGTAEKFGKAIATAFEGAIKWAEGFVASFDWDGIVTRLQAFAGEAQRTFTQVGEWATNAGNTVKLAYGVMSGGVNAVLTAIYGIGSVFAEIAESVMSGVARLRDGLAAVTFGSLSESFRLAAEDARNSAQGFGDAAQAMRDKASASLQDTADAAHLTRGAFEGLAGAAERAGERAGQAFSKIAEKIKATGPATQASVRAIDNAIEAHNRQLVAVDKSIAAQQALREEYAQAIETGNVQRAAEIMLRLKAANEAAAASAKGNAKKQEEAAKEIAAAFERMGIKTNRELKDNADLLRKSFELIRDSGEASADSIAMAWQKAADAAIAANDGVVPAWVQGEAEAKGYAIQVDEAGKATLQLVKTSAALKGLASGFDAASAAAGRYNQALTGGRLGAGAGSGGSGAGGGRQGFGGRKGPLTAEDLGLDPNEDRRGQKAGHIGPNQEIKSMLGDTREKRMEGQNAVDASLQFRLRDKLNAGTLTPDDIEDMKAVIAALKQNNDLNGSAAKMSAGYQSLDGQRDAQAWRETGARFEDLIKRFEAPQRAQASNVVIKIDGKPDRNINTDQAGAGVIEEVLRELAFAKGNAA